MERNSWPPKDKREDYEITEFIKAYQSLTGRVFTIQSRGERPDYIVRDSKASESLGVELTSVYLSDRSVPDDHIAKPDPFQIPYDKSAIGKYKDRLFQAICEKVKKANNGYDFESPLILSIYVNEYLSIYMEKEDWNSFARDHESFWHSISPFIEVVFWPLCNSCVFSITSTGMYTWKRVD